MLSLLRSGLLALGLLGIFFPSSIFAMEEGVVWTSSELAGDGLAGFQDGAGSSARFTFSQGTAGVPWLSGVAFTEDERSVVVVDSWNQAIRQVNIESREVETLVQANTREAPLIAAQDFALSGIATFGSFLVFSNNWNANVKDNSDARLEFYDAQFGGRSRADTTSITGSGPEGIAMISDNEMIFSQRNAGLWQLNFDSRAETHKAGPEVIADWLTTKGWNDGVGKNAQMSSPAGLTANADGSAVYFVDSVRCNLRRLDVATNQVTTIAGARTGTATDGICNHVDGDATTARFKNPIDCALLPNEEDLLVTEASHSLRLVNLESGEVTTLAGTPNEAGLRNGRGASIQFNFPSGVAAVADKIAIADSGNHIVRLLRKSCLPYFILVLGTCRACETPLCPLGSFRAPCTETVVDAVCEECPIKKPENSNYKEGVQDCSWTCIDTHEKTIDGKACQLKPVLGGQDEGISDEAVVAIVAACCAFLLLVTGGVLYYIRDMDMSRFFSKKKAAETKAIEAPKDSELPQQQVPIAPPPAPVQASEAEAAGVGSPPPVDPMIAALNASGFDSSPFQQQAFGR